jgi:hypothetical protein
MKMVHSACFNLCDVAYVYVDYVLDCYILIHRSLVKGVDNFPSVCKEWCSKNGGRSPCKCGQLIFH